MEGTSLFSVESEGKEFRGLESGIYFLRMRSFDGSSNLTEQVVVEKE